MPSLKGIASSVKKAASGGSTSDSGLKKLKITAYSDAACTNKKSGDPYKAQFNPTSLTQSLKINYTDDSSLGGATSGIKKFKNIDSSDLEIKLILDGTGVTGALGTKGSGGTFGLSGDEVDVSDELDAFKKVTCEYDGEHHEIPYVKIEWGKLDFKGRLTQLDIKHVLFNSQGKPIRTELSAKFASAKDLKTQVKEKANSSPDLTHIRVVEMGDTLPLMCQRIYNDSSYYLKVARFNNLVDFRNLEPGIEITFPPII